ncbi:MAG: hypothetical protein V4443_12210 [Pseudomonadota bacterium]
MAVLGSQPTRDSYSVQHDYLDAFLAEAAKMAKKHSITIESVIEAKRVLEMERKNSILSLAGDYHDEQMGGFGDILSRIADALESKE